MDFFTWKGGAGDLSVAANWVAQPVSPDPVEPGASDGVFIGGTGTLVGALDVESANFTGNLTLAGQIVVEEALVNQGTFTVSGAAARMTGGSLDLGGQGLATLALSGGAAIAMDGAPDGTTKDAGLNVGAGLNWQGAVTIASGATLTAAGVLLGAYDGSSGSLALHDTGSALKSDADVEVGSAGAGVLSVAAGAALAETSGDFGISVAAAAGGTGAFSISGKGSTVRDAGFLEVGYAGAGTLNVSSGGAITLGAAKAGGVQQGISVGDQAGADGEITVRGEGSSISDAGFLILGSSGAGSLAVSAGASVSVRSAEFGVELGENAGANGSLVVSGGGALTVNKSALTIGMTAGATGSVRVTGAGSMINTNGFLSVGDFGAGALVIAAGGRLNDTNATVGLSAGAEVGSNGNVRVEGAGSTLSLASYLDVGYSGKATLSVTGGAVVSLGAPQPTESVMAVGIAAGASGAVTVDGPGSSLSASQGIEIAYQGHGSLSITNGASVDAGSSTPLAFDIGSLAGSAGSVSVSGAGSKLVSASGLYVGHDGAGWLSVTSGATLTVGTTLLFGADFGGSGKGIIRDATVTVGQTGIMGDGVWIGNFGAGALTLGAGGVLTDLAVAGVGAGSTLTMAGGAFSSTRLTNEGSVAGFGTLKGPIVNDGAIRVSGGALRLNGSITGSGSERIAAGGTLHLAGASLDAGGTLVGVVGSNLDGSGDIGSTVSTAGTVTSIGGFKFTGVGNVFAGVLAGSVAISFSAGSDTFKNTIITAAKVNVTGASLTLSGDISVSGNLTVAGAVKGTGTVTIESGVSDFAGTFHNDVTFGGGAGTLELGQSQGYTGKITGFSTSGGTALDLSDIAFKSGATKASYSGTAASGVLTVTSGSEVATIHLVGDFRSAVWALSNDGHGGTKVVDPTKANLSVTLAPDVTTAHSLVQAMAGFGAVTAATAAPVAEPWRAASSVLASPRAA